MHTWNTVWRTLVCGALLLVLPGGGCVISIDPLDGGGGGNGGGAGGQFTIRLINATDTTLDPELYIADGPVSITQLFERARKFTAYGVGTLGLLGPFGSDTVTVNCTAAIVIGTRGGAFGDDLNDPDGTGRQIVLTQDVNVFCGDTITFTYERSGSGFETDFRVSR